MNLTCRDASNIAHNWQLIPSSLDRQCSGEKKKEKRTKISVFSASSQSSVYYRIATKWAGTEQPTLVAGWFRKSGSQSPSWSSTLGGQESMTGFPSHRPAVGVYRWWVIVSVHQATTDGTDVVVLLYARRKTGSYRILVLIFLWYESFVSGIACGSAAYSTFGSPRRASFYQRTLLPCFIQISSVKNPSWTEQIRSELSKVQGRSTLTWHRGVCTGRRNCAWVFLDPTWSPACLISCLCRGVLALNKTTSIKQRFSVVRLTF